MKTCCINVNLNRILLWIRFFGIALFAWILTKINWVDVSLAFSGLNFTSMCEYFLILILLLYLKVSRFFFIVKRLNYPVQFFDIGRIIVESSFYGVITPGRVGEFTKFFFLKQAGLTSSESWALLLMERLSDLLVLLSTIIILLFYFFYPVRYGSFIYLSVFILIYLMTFLVIFNFGKFLELLNSLFRSLSGKSNFYQELVVTANKLDKLSAVYFLPNAILSLWLSFFALRVLVLGLGVKINVLYLCLKSIISMLLFLSPDDL